MPRRMTRMLKIFRKQGALILLGVFYLYLVLHAVSGSQGIFKLSQYDTQIVDLRADLVQIQAQRLTLEQEASQLRSSSLDIDRLDEDSRRLLSVSHVKDIVIFLDD